MDLLLILHQTAMHVMNFWEMNAESMHLTVSLASVCQLLIQSMECGVQNNANPPSPCSTTPIRCRCSTPYHLHSSVFQIVLHLSAHQGALALYGVQAHNGFQATSDNHGRQCHHGIQAHHDHHGVQYHHGNQCHLNVKGHIMVN